MRRWDGGGGGGWWLVVQNGEEVGMGRALYKGIFVKLSLNGSLKT
jgi:hypothetical protein